MERTRWAITYDGIRRDVLLSLAAMPYGGDHLLGHGCSDGDPDLLSPREDEQKLVSLVAVVYRMMERCEETLQHTPQNYLCWLRSTKTKAYYPKPFSLVSLKASKKKYIRLFQRFVVFLFRAFRMPSSVRRRLTRIRFTKRQLEQLEAIWEHEALENTELARDSPSEPANFGRGMSNFKEPRQEDREKSFGSLFDGEDNVDCGSEDGGVVGEVDWDNDEDEDEDVNEGEDDKEAQDEEEYDEERDERVQTVVGADESPTGRASRTHLPAQYGV